MNLDATHPLYDKFANRWQEVEDAIEGAEAIKGESYLPKPGGMYLIPEPQQTKAYNAYALRATYPELVNPTVRGLAGVIHKEPIKFELPPALEHLREKATVDGLTLESLCRRLTKSQLSYGRVGVAMTAQAGKPIFAVYEAKAIRNWAEDQSLVVLDEGGDEMRDDLTWEHVDRRLVIELEEGKAKATRHTLAGGNWSAEEDDMFAGRGGAALGFLPFVFIDTADLTPNPDEVPLLPVARLAAKMYRQDASYQATLYYSSAPQPGIRGMAPDDPMRPQTWGGGGMWYLPSAEQEAFLLEFTGASADKQKEAMQSTLEAAIMAGARLFSTADEQAESGEARKIKYAAQTATLVGIAQTMAAGVETLLKMAALFAGASPDAVKVEVETDFIGSELGADIMREIRENVAVGIYSKQTGYEMLQAGNRANKERSWDDEKEMIEQDFPTGTIGREDDDAE